MRQVVHEDYTALAGERALQALDQLIALLTARGTASDRRVSMVAIDEVH